MKINRWGYYKRVLRMQNAKTNLRMAVSWRMKRRMIKRDAVKDD